jgi:UDP-N-acetylmuramoyl-L-alanyl-D-glutamate--2,6-diaminopimelate ligase
MQLGDIFDQFSLDIIAGALEITRVEIDSRLCTDGTLFFAMPGKTANGVQYIKDAVANGAVAVVTTELVDIDETPQLLAAPTQIRPLLAHASACVTGFPNLDMELVGVTGTNGKTSVTSLVAQLAKELGWNAGNIGTLTNARTTPDSPELFRTLRELRNEFDNDASKSVVAMEVSSHALDQGRTTGLTFEVGAFTNLSHDHLDYHETMEKYFEAKAKLFESSTSSQAVIWGDDPYGKRLIDEVSIPVTVASRHDVSEVVMSITGTTFFWRGHLVNSSLIGGYNIDNTIMALSIVSALGASDEAAAQAMSSVFPVSGRFEVVHSGSFSVIVDYAHTPDGLKSVLRDVRGLMQSGRLITVFGCGGDRDVTKRPEMGALATQLSDITIVTSDNPRTESPDAIIDAVLSGAVEGKEVERVVDRRSAIAKAIESAIAGDVIVVAGKGHETTQTIGELVTHFDDREVIRELLGMEPYA